MKNAESLLSESYYHIYNHAVGNENLFRTSENYYYFLSKYAQYIYPICETYCYCLMPNHFHFVLKVRSESELIDHFNYLKSEGKIKSGLEKISKPDLSLFVMQQFSNFFNAYTKAYNRMFNRKGGLFIDYMKRKKVTSEKYFIRLIQYIHQNPIHHNFCKNIDDWEFSSYHAFISDRKTKVNRNQVLKWFGGRASFIDIHRIINKTIPELEF